jgi:hypothetical protein
MTIVQSALYNSALAGRNVAEELIDRLVREPSAG